MSHPCLSEGNSHDIAMSTVSVYSEVQDFSKPNIHHGDRSLPVVELKPFTREVWRRENSLPEYYDKIKNVGAEDSVKQALFEGDKNVSPTDKKETIVSAALVYKYLGKEEPRKYLETEMNMSRYKIRIHPSVDFSYNYRLKRPKALIPEFIPRIQRSKHTSQSAMAEENENRAYSCSKQHLSERMALKQQDMKLLGDKLRHCNGVQKTSLHYLNPMEKIGQSRAWYGGNHRAILDETRSLSPAKLVKTPSIDGSHVSYVNPHAVHGPTSDTRSLYSGGNKGKQLGKAREKTSIIGQKQNVSVTIGGAKNALEILSKMGPPTVLEKQLTFEMKLNMEKYRRHIGYPVLEGLTAVQQPYNANMFYDVNRSMTLTRGETLLKHGQKLNRAGLKSGQEERISMNRKQTRGKQTASVEFDWHIHPGEDLQSTSDLSSPRMEILESVLSNGLLNPISRSPRSPIHINNHHSRDGISKPSFSNPATSGCQSRGNNVKSILESDIHLEEVKDEVKVQPRSASRASGASPTIGMYITEACDDSRGRSLDSCILVERITVDTQTSSIKETQYKPNSVKLKDGIGRK